MRAALIAAVACAFASVASAAPMCRFEGGQLAFGDNDPLAARGRVAATAIGEATVRCDGGGEIDIELHLQDDRGRQGFGEAGPGVDFVLYIDPARRLRWGDPRLGGRPIRRRVNADGRQVVIPIFGELHADGAGRPGQYTTQLRVEVRQAPMPR